MAAVGHPPQLPSQKQKTTPPVTQLEFHQAMTDFKTMFPEMDEDVIEVVLRANNGAVDATIDQLLSMSTDNENERLRTEMDATENDELPPSYSPATPPPSYHQAVPYAHSPGRSLMAPRSRKTSGSSPSLMRHMQLLNQRLPGAQALPSIARIPPPKKEKEETDTDLNCAPLRYQRKWNPPLVGPLPASFLRLDDRQQNKARRGKYVTILSSAVLQKRMQENERQRRNTIGAEDPEMAQYLEDERIALFLQNEEFVRELMGNKEFMSSLEKDATNDGNMTLQSRQSQTLKGAEKHLESLNCQKSEDKAQMSRSLSGDDSDAAFRERLKNMGKTSRRKFAQLASIFSRRKRPFKPILGDGSNPSRDNLLLTEDEYAQLSEEDSDTDWNKKDSWNSHHGESEENSKLEHSKTDNT